MNHKEKQEKFLDLLDQHKERFSRFARAITGNRDDALDLINDTIVAAFENFEKIRNHYAFGAYIYSIALRIYKRKVWRSRIFGVLNQEYEEIIPVRESNAETNIDVEILYKALDKLPESQKEAVILFEISGFSLEEIQAIQGGSLSGVKSRLKRARERLVGLMQDNYFSKKTNILSIKGHKENIYELIKDDYYQLRVENEYK
ncbi:MAG: RNA polymerase sigma factor [Candidatus Kapabacteria bacterium]|nr:RNA polymerase sigma factor [Candidatus Kapabacteria bacterium]